MGCCQNSYNGKLDFTLIKTMEELYSYLLDYITRVNTITKLISSGSNEKQLLEKLPPSLDLELVSDISLMQYYELLKKNLLSIKIYLEFKNKEKLTVNYRGNDNNNKNCQYREIDLKLLTLCLNDMMSTEETIDIVELEKIKTNILYVNLYKNITTF